MARPSRLRKVLDALAEHQGAAAGGPPAEPWAAVLWLNVVAAADEAKRDEVFAALERATGLEPARIDALSAPQLEALCGPSRSAPERAAAIRRVVQHARTVGDPDAIVGGAAEHALAALAAFPGVSRHDAERILTFAGLGDAIVFDALGLRTAVRIGYGDETGDEELLRRTAQAAAALELGDDEDARVEIVRRLRRHGIERCTKRPNCDACAIAHLCDTARLDGKNR